MSTVKPTPGNKQNSQVRWYQVPVLWLCIAIFLLTLAACAHLIMVSLEADKNHPASETNNMKKADSTQQNYIQHQTLLKHNKIKQDEVSR